MQFAEAQAIYLQIAASIEEKIIRNEWIVGERIPSVRDLAVAMEVNPNTVARTYEYLQQKEVIFNKRGIGYFVSENARQSVLNERKKQFSKRDLPVFLKNMDLLDITWEEMTSYYQQYIQQQNNKTV